MNMKLATALVLAMALAACGSKAKKTPTTPENKGGTSTEVQGAGSATGGTTYGGAMTPAGGGAMPGGAGDPCGGGK